MSRFVARTVLPCALLFGFSACGNGGEPTGPPTPPVAAAPTVPAAPTGLSVTAGDGEASVAFTAGSDGGSAITNYHYQLDGGAWTAADPAVTTSPLLITGLTNGTPYSIRLRAENAVGLGAQSAEVAVTPVGPAEVEFYALAGGRGEAYAVSTFADGSAIVAGRGGGTFGSSTTASSMFVARVAPDGSWAWARGPGATSSEYGYAVAALPDGSALVAGQFAGTAPFGSFNLVSAGGTDIFVAKIDANGEWLWATRAGGADSEEALSISAQADGGAIVSGSFGSGTASFGTTSLNLVDGSDAYVARIGPTGEWEWATSAGGPNAEIAQSVSALPGEGAIVTGFFTGTMSFGSDVLTANVGNDVFVAKISQAGAWEWATKGGGLNATVSQSVAVLPDGGALVAGYFFGSAVFGGTTLTSAGVDDAFVARISSAGEWTWAIRGGGSRQASAQSLAALPDGGGIVTGHFIDAASLGAFELTGAGGNDVFVARVSPGGDWTWAVGAGGSVFDMGRSASVFADGSAIVAGTVRGPAAFGTTGIESTSGANHVFVAKIGPDGDW